MREKLTASLVLALTLATGPGLFAESDPSKEAPEPFYVDGLTFESRQDFAESEYFKASGYRCGTMDRELRELLFSAPEGPEGNPADCSSSSTSPTGWDPNEQWEVQVVFHIIEHTDGVQGQVSDSFINSQMEIFNEDFQALFGTPGQNGNNSMVQFVLASEDPMGNPTTGITHNENNTWFNDGGAYYNTLAWDPNRYINIYSNNASGNLGYVPFLPADGGGAFVGTAQDRVVVLWNTIGRNSPFGPPYDQGRTVAHEVGHYLGLEHTFSGSCAVGTSPACYSNGDLICDTPPQSGQTFGCPLGATSCSGALNPIRNYMNYTDDTCMEEFTPEQVNRMRCTLVNYREDLYQVVAGSEIFDDGFESGDTNAW